MSYLSHKPIEREQYMLTYLYNDFAFILTIRNGKAGLSNIFKKEDKAVSTAKCSQHHWGNAGKNHNRIVLCTHSDGDYK